MPELGWDIAETLEIQEKRQKTNNTPLALQTIVTIIIIILVIVRLSTTQLGKLAMFLKEAVITTIGISHNVYEQNMKRLDNTTIAAIALATSMMNCTDCDKMNPNKDRNSHHQLLIPVAPPKEERYLQRLVRPTEHGFRQVYAKTE